jgi:hypothetical protein
MLFTERSSVPNSVSLITVVSRPPRTNFRVFLFNTGLTYFLYSIVLLKFSPKIITL